MFTDGFIYLLRNEKLLALECALENAVWSRQCSSRKLLLLLLLTQEANVCMLINNTQEEGCLAVDSEPQVSKS